MQRERPSSHTVSFAAADSQVSTFQCGKRNGNTDLPQHENVFTVCCTVYYHSSESEVSETTEPTTVKFYKCAINKTSPFNLIKLKWLKFSDTVMQWFALLHHSNGVLCWSLHVLPVFVWVLSGVPGFLPQSKDMHSGDVQTGYLKLALVWMWVWIVCQPCNELMTWPECVAQRQLGQAPPVNPSSHERNTSMHEEIKMQGKHAVQKHLKVIRSDHFPHQTETDEQVDTGPLKWDIVLYYWQLFPQVVFLLCLMLALLNQSQKNCL